MPREGRVRAEIVVSLLGAFGLLDCDAQRLVLTFVALTLDLLDDVGPVSRLYVLFFHYLDYATLRYVFLSLSLVLFIDYFGFKRKFLSLSCVCAA